MIVKKYSKSEVRYTDDHGASSEQCSKCEHFEEESRLIAFGSTCRIVVGRIVPGGWCNQFARKK